MKETKVTPLSSDRRGQRCTHEDVAVAELENVTGMAGIVVGIAGSACSQRPPVGDGPRQIVQAHFEEQWSQEQISSRLPQLFPEGAELRVSHETIYAIGTTADPRLPDLIPRAREDLQVNTLELHLGLHRN